MPFDVIEVPEAGMLFHRNESQRTFWGLSLVVLPEYFYYRHVLTDTNTLLMVSDLE